MDWNDKRKEKAAKIVEGLDETRCGCKWEDGCCKALEGEHCCSKKSKHNKVCKCFCGEEKEKV